MTSTNSTKRIFVLDDERDMTLLTGTLLKLRGFTITTENDPAAALKTLESNDFEMIVIDLMMPRLDGFAVLRTLRQSVRHANTPILVFSAKRMNDVERKALIEARAQFLAKPCIPTEFVRVVTRKLEDAQPPGANGPS